MTAIVKYLILFLAVWTCEAYKILVVYPVPTKSHSILGDGVVRNLLKDGHEVTYISPFEYKNAPPNLRIIDVSSNVNHFPTDTINLSKILDNATPATNIHMVKKMLTNLSVRTVQNENVQRFLTDPKENFDVVIVEWMFSDVLSGFATIFNCPLIWKTPVEVTADVIRLVDAVPNPAHSSGLFTETSPPFNFWGRVVELWQRMKLKYFDLMYYDEMEAKAYETHIVPLIRKRGREPPSYYDVRYNASLVLGNSHVSMGSAVTIPQSYKPVGGYHIEEEVKPLPEDLKKIMDTAKHGVIYFSMGSNLKSKHWPEDIKRGLLEMFGGLKQTVLWKFEENLPNLPKNVYILQWAPQPSILSHPNLLLFISHGGLLSTTETIHYGVPIIGVPAFGDQFLNVKRAVNRGFAIGVRMSRNLPQDLKSAIEQMVSNSRYKERVKELSFIYHDRPVKPGAELVHWVKHVVRTRGALHLRSPALHVPLYQLLYLDLLSIVAAILLATFILFKFLFSLVCSKKRDSKQKKN